MTDDPIRQTSPRAPSPEPARRTRVCLTCRTLFDSDESCSGKKHETVSLLETKGRERLDDEVWGPDSRARALRRAAKAGAGGAGVGSIWQGCDLPTGLDGCEGGGEAILILLAVIVFALVAIVLFWIIRAIVRWLREALHRPQPHGALLDPPKPQKRAIAARGVVKTGTPLTTPWEAGNVLGYAMELYGERVLGGGAMLRDARVAGFDVTLDDGRVLRIPSGRVRILGKRERVDADASRVESFIRDLDPSREEGGRPLFPFAHARALTIAPGDRVEVLGDLELSGDARVGYRENAGIVSPVGVPVLRVHKADGGGRVRIDDDAAKAGAEAEALEQDEPQEEEVDEVEDAKAKEAAGR